MKSLKYITVAALATGMLFQLGGCGPFGTIGTVLLGLVAISGGLGT